MLFMKNLNKENRRTSRLLIVLSVSLCLIVATVFLTNLLGYVLDEWTVICFVVTWSTGMSILAVAFNDSEQRNYPYLKKLKTIFLPSLLIIAGYFLIPFAPTFNYELNSDLWIFVSCYVFLYLSFINIFAEAIFRWNYSL